MFQIRVMILISADEKTIKRDQKYSNDKLNKHQKQAGAELCQAQFKLAQAKQCLPNLFSKDKLVLPCLGFT